MSQLVRQAVCAGDELHDLTPHITEKGNSGQGFRRRQRQRIDAEVAAFDPKIIHVHGLGSLGHLALETGVPYLMSTWGDELVAPQPEARWHIYAQQAAENAGQIVVNNHQTEQRVLSAFGDCTQRIVLLSARGWPAASSATMAIDEAPPLDWLWDLYREIVAQRCRFAGQTPS